MKSIGGKKLGWRTSIFWGLSVGIVLLFYGTRWFFGRLMVPNDFYIHYTWATFFTNRLAAGCLTPVWLPEVFQGLGAAIFLYYPPLYYYGVGILNLVLGNTWLAMRIVEGLAAFGIAWFAARYARKNLGSGLMDGLLAVCVVACSPVLLARLYMLGGLPSYVSCFFMTAAAVRTVDIIQQGKHGWDWLLTFWIGLLSWTHNLMVLMALAAIFGGLVFLAVFRRRVPYGTIIGSCILGFALGLPRFFSAFIDMPSINHQNIVQLEELLWQNHFLLPVGLKTSWAFFQWGLGGLLAFGICLWGLVLLCNRLAPSNSHAFWLGGSLTCLFFALPLSWFFWKWLPPLQYFQSPTRFLDPLCLFTALGLCCAFRELGPSRIGWYLRIPLWLFVAGSLALVARVWQLGISVEPELESWLHATSNQWEYLPAGQPVGWRQLPDIQPQQIVNLPDGEVRVLPPGKDGGLVADFQQDGNALRLLPIFHHDRWEVYVDGKKTPFQKDEGTGLIQVMLSGGHHRIVTKWSQSYWDLLSSGALILLLVGVPAGGIVFAKQNNSSKGLLSPKALE